MDHRSSPSVDNFQRCMAMAVQSVLSHATQQKVEWLALVGASSSTRPQKSNRFVPAISSFLTVTSHRPPISSRISILGSSKSSQRSSAPHTRLAFHLTSSGEKSPWKIPVPRATSGFSENLKTYPNFQATKRFLFHKNGKSGISSQSISGKILFRKWPSNHRCLLCRCHLCCWGSCNDPQFQSMWPRSIDVGFF